MHFIELTDMQGKRTYLRHDVIEGTSADPEEGTRVFVHTGFYKVQESVETVMAKLRDIAVLKAQEANQ